MMRKGIAAARETGALISCGGTIPMPKSHTTRVVEMKGGGEQEAGIRFMGI